MLCDHWLKFDTLTRLPSRIELENSLNLSPTANHTSIVLRHLQEHSPIAVLRYRLRHTLSTPSQFELACCWFFNAVTPTATPNQLNLAKHAGIANTKHIDAYYLLPPHIPCTRLHGTRLPLWPQNSSCVPCEPGQGTQAINQESVVSRAMRTSPMDSSHKRVPSAPA